MRKIKRGLITGFLASFLAIAFLLTFAISVFAQKPRTERGYTYNLKQLIEQAEENIEKVDKQLEKREIRKRNEEREAKVREHFEKGNSLYKEGKLKEARQEWQKALEISKTPELEGYIRESVRRAKEKISSLLSEAHSLYQEKAYTQAQEKYQEVLTRDSENRTALRYLEIIPEKIEEAKREEKIARLTQEAKPIYQEALRFYRQKEYAKAKEKFQKVHNIYPEYEKASYYLERIDQDIQRQKERIRKKKAESIYDQAYSSYRDKEYQKAQELFKELEEFYPGYKNTQDYLKRIPEDIEQVRIDSLLDKADVLYKQEQYTQAEEVYKQVLKIEPEDRTASTYLERIPQKIQEKEREQLEQKAQPIYDQALHLYQAKDYQASLEKFKEAEGILAGYRKAQYYIERIPEDIQREKEHRLNEQARVIYDEALSLYKAKDYQQAKEEFQKAAQIVPGYARVDYYLKRILEDIERQKQRQLREKIQSLNKEGKNLYRNKNYDEATAKFKEVLRLDPENKYALRYLELIPKRIEEEKERLERKRQKELEKRQREKQRELERQKKEKEKRRREETRKQLKKKEELEKEKIKKSKKAIQEAKETAKDTREETKLSLEDLTYKTEKGCLDVLGKNPDDKQAFDNLVNLYLLRDELLNDAKELYKNKDYQGAIQDYNKVLLIEPDNKEAKVGIKRAHSRMK